MLTGSPIREELLKGNKEAAYELTGFNKGMPVIMVMGGSQGASAINRVVREALPRLLNDFQVIHICGNDKMDNLLLNMPGYKQFEYVRTELKDLFAITDLVISRAGANAICELLALRIPNILVPLPLEISRGDQLLNAQSFEDQGYSMVIKEESLDEDSLVEGVQQLYFNRDRYVETMSRSHQYNSVETIINLIEEICNEKG